MEKAPGICSDAITRIPWIWRWPSHFPAGRVAEEIVETVDLANTLCALAGIDPMETADGKDLSRILEGQRGQVHSIGVTEFAWSKSVRKGSFRLVYYPTEMFADQYPDGFGELYDLATDPWEMRNLYFEPEHQDKVRELERELVDWLVTTTRPATVHPVGPFPTRQGTTRYGHTVNHDGKIHPDHVRAMKGRNYL